jgi:S1-C subfamily serine protease
MSAPDFLVYADKIATALKSYRRDEAIRECRELISALSVAGIAVTDDSAIQILDTLRSHRFFDLMRDVADAFIRAGAGGPKVRRQYAQAMIELGDFGSARSVLNNLANELPIDHAESAEADGLLGRLYKQRYVNASADIQNSFSSYWRVYERDKTKYWHAANVLAVAKRAERDHVKLPVTINIGEIAKNVRESISQLPSPSHWDLATSAEAALASGNFTQAVTDYLAFAEHPNIDAFAVASALRQLNEVWRIDLNQDASRDLDQMLSAKLLKLNGGEVELSSAQISRQLSTDNTQYEKIFGSDAAVTLRWYKTGLTCCDSVARIGRDPSRGVGTGFLMKGESLSELWRGITVLITNAHVVSEDSADCAIHPQDASIYFEQKNITTTVKKVLWSSKRNDLDISILELDAAINISSDLQVAKNVPLVSPETRLYIIGHPGGGTLSISLQDNQFIEFNDKFLRYRTPTEGGNSGSPVFNAKWELVGVHHAGGSSIPKLGGAGSDDANEGVRWSAISAAITTL